MANHSQYPLSDVDGKLSISINAVAAFMTSVSTLGRLQFNRTFDIVLFLLAAGSALVLVVWLLSDGLTEHSTLLFTRYTARLSFVFFCLCLPCMHFRYCCQRY